MQINGLHFTYQLYFLEIENIFFLIAPGSDLILQSSHKLSLYGSDLITQEKKYLLGDH